MTTRTATEVKNLDAASRELMRPLTVVESALIVEITRLRVAVAAFMAATEDHDDSAEDPCELCLARKAGREVMTP